MSRILPSSVSGRHAFSVAALVALLAVVGCDSGTDPSPRLTVNLSATPAAITVDGSSTLTATVTHDGEPSPGWGVQWELSGPAGLSSGGAATNAQGIVTATLRGVGESGVATVRVSVLSRSESDSAEVRIGLD